MCRPKPLLTTHSSPSAPSPTARASACSPTSGRKSSSSVSPFSACEEARKTASPLQPAHRRRIAAELHQNGRKRRDGVPESLGERVRRAVRAELPCRLSARGKHDGVRPLRSARKGNAEAPVIGQFLHARPRQNTHRAALQLAAEQIGDGGSLPPRGIYPAAGIGQKEPAHVFEKAHGVPRRKARKDAGDLLPVVRKIVRRVHIPIGHVSLTVARRRKLFPETLPPFEDRHAFSRFCKQHGARHARRAAADHRNFHHILIIQYLKLFVNALTGFVFRDKME